jgi:hypothetical protein
MLRQYSSFLSYPKSRQTDHGYREAITREQFTKWILSSIQLVRRHEISVRWTPGFLSLLFNELSQSLSADAASPKRSECITVKYPMRETLPSTTEFSRVRFGGRGVARASEPTETPSVATNIERQQKCSTSNQAYWNVMKDKHSEV